MIPMKLKIQVGLTIIRSLVVWILLCLPMMLLGILLLPIVLLFIPRDVENLPRFLRWFDNYSGVVRKYPAGDGLSGGPIYRTVRAVEGHTNLFWERYYWLALRNPINYFSCVVLGVTTEGLEQINENVKVYGDPDVGDQSKSGCNITTWSVGSKDLICFYYVKAYTLFGKDLCIRIRMGYKPQPAVGVLFPNGYVCSINPVMPFTGTH